MAGLLVTACSPPGTVEVRLGKHSLEVPAANIRGSGGWGTVFLWKLSQTDQDPIYFTVDLATEVCNSTNSQLPHSSCNPDYESALERLREHQSLLRSGDDVFWNFEVQIDRKPDPRVIVARCYASAGGPQSGSCTGAGRCGDFLFSYSFAERSSKALIQIHDGICMFLKTWERSSENEL